MFLDKPNVLIFFRQDLAQPCLSRSLNAVKCQLKLLNLYLVNKCKKKEKAEINMYVLRFLNCGHFEFAGTTVTRLCIMFGKVFLK